MTDIAVEPIIMTASTLKVGADNYEAHVSTVSLDPSASSVTWKGLSPAATFTKVSKATWVCNLAYAQDWETANSLSNYLYDHEGETIAVEFAPEDGGQAWAVNLVITPGAIGGAVDTVAVGSVALGVSGRPTRVVAP